MSNLPSSARIPWPEPPTGSLPILNTDRRAHATGVFPTSGINIAALNTKVVISWNNEGADGQSPAGAVWFDTNASDRPFFHGHATTAHIVAANLWLRININLSQDDGNRVFPAHIGFRIWDNVNNVRTLIHEVEYELPDDGNLDWDKDIFVKELSSLLAGQKISFEIELIKAQDSNNPPQQMTLSGNAITLLNSGTEAKIIMR